MLDERLGVRCTARGRCTRTNPLKQMSYCSCSGVLGPHDLHVLSGQELEEAPSRKTAGGSARAGSSWVACLLRPLPLTDHAFPRLITPVVVTTGHVACSPSAWSSFLMTIQSSWVEIACDESGFSGTNLLDPASPVITHASVDLAVPEAAEVVAVLRSRLRRRSEYKSNQLLRPEQRPALEWFLTALRGRAHVHVIDKTGYVAARVLELFTEEPSYGAGTSLGRDHSDAVLALRRRTGFLAAFVDLTRTKRVRLIDHDAIDRFFATMPADLPALREVTRGAGRGGDGSVDRRGSRVSASAGAAGARARRDAAVLERRRAVGRRGA